MYIMYKFRYVVCQAIKKLLWFDSKQDQFSKFQPLKNWSFEVDCTNAKLFTLGKWKSINLGQMQHTK